MTSVSHPPCSPISPLPNSTYKDDKPGRSLVIVDETVVTLLFASLRSAAHVADSFARLASSPINSVISGCCPHPRAPGALALSLDRERDPEGQGEVQRGKARRASAALTDRISSEENRTYLALAAIIRARVIGKSRMRKPSARATAFVTAAAAGPCAASPTPSGGVSGESMSSTFTSGTSSKRMIGYSSNDRVVTRLPSKPTCSLSVQLID